MIQWTHQWMFVSRSIWTNQSFGTNIGWPARSGKQKWLNKRFHKADADKYLKLIGR